MVTEARLALDQNILKILTVSAGVIALLAGSAEHGARASALQLACNRQGKPPFDLVVDIEHGVAFSKILNLDIHNGKRTRAGDGGVADEFIEAEESAVLFGTEFHPTVGPVTRDAYILRNDGLLTVVSGFFTMFKAQCSPGVVKPLF